MKMSWLPQKCNIFISALYMYISIIDCANKIIKIKVTNLPNITEFVGPRLKEEAINMMRHLTRGGFVECFTSRRRVRWWSNGRANGAAVAGIKGYSIQRTLEVKKPTRGRYNIIPLKILKLIFCLYLGHDTETNIFAYNLQVYLSTSAHPHLTRFYKDWPKVVAALGVLGKKRPWSRGRSY